MVVFENFLDVSLPRYILDIRKRPWGRQNLKKCQFYVNILSSEILRIRSKTISYTRYKILVNHPQLDILGSYLW